MLIYAPRISSRLRFVTDELLHRRLGIGCELTKDKQAFIEAIGPKLCYDLNAIDGSIHIQPANNLLLNDEIVPLNIQVIDVKWWVKIFFPSNGEIPFDIFSAAFYLLSRYEEYTHFVPDKHGRFDAEESLAYKNNFLQLPLVDIWAMQLKWHLENKYPQISFTLPEFQFLSTIDIDFAYRYRGIGFKRYWLKFLNELVHFRINNLIEQLKVGFSYNKDPYDTYHWIEKTCKDSHLDLRYFVLLSSGNDFDKNIKPFDDVMRNLVARLPMVGLHPSYYSTENIDLLAHEQRILESYIRKRNNFSRQHYLRYRLPETYEQLVQADISEDYSTGYAGYNGFRASTCHPFAFFNLEKNRCFPLTLHPMSIMDVNFKMRDASPADAYHEAEQLMNEVKKVNGAFICLWHNSNLSHHEGWEPWREVFLKIHTLASSKLQQEID